MSEFTLVYQECNQKTFSVVIFANLYLYYISQTQVIEFLSSHIGKYLYV